MNYFEILNLRAEPFSNSPDPDFLYRSEGHERCLHELEIAIRLRRGLSVVLGEVGTGKTTLCRELLRQLDGDKDVRAHLLLDPGFSSPRELLAVLHEMFCGAEAGDMTPWQLKEAIKDSILAEAVDKERILALVVDEGQKMPVPCMEVLRELLNFETNDRKLLQIVVFAQSEFQDTLAAVPNLSDRVNDLIRLEPLTLAETRAMIRHRLELAKADFRAPKIFSPLGWVALHHATGGYPRRVIRLAHKVLLALILQRKRRAGWGLVHAVARYGEVAPPRRSGHWLATPALAVAVVALWFGVLGGDLSELQRLDVVHNPIMEQVLPPAQAAVEPAPAPKAEARTEAKPEAKSGPLFKPSFEVKPGPILGRVKISRGDQLSIMARALYGQYTEATVELVRQVNAGMADPDQVEIGDTVKFPTAGLRPAPAWWARIYDRADLQSAVAAWRRYSPRTTRIVPYLTEDGATRFAVVLGWPCATADEARRFMDRDLGQGAELVHGQALTLPWLKGQM